MIRERKIQILSLLVVGGAIALGVTLRPEEVLHVSAPAYA